MFQNITRDQLYELRAALHEHFNQAFADHSETIAALEIGSEGMAKAMREWDARRDNILALQDEVIKEIDKQPKPKVIRRVHHAE